MTYRKKLIEVSLPLEAINKEAAREKSIRHGHPSTLHLWWARRPLAACRAVLFASLVDDPSEYMPDEESARVERERIFDIIEELVKWENSNNEVVLDKARLEIARSVARTLDMDSPIGKEAVREFLATKAPPVLDPFAGGGSIPLEAQRLGLRAYASDLNPVAVLINKALIEIPPKFANMPPIHPPEEAPAPKKKGEKGEGTMPLFAREWKGAQGLAEDVRYYGKWMRDEAFKRIGHLYPPVTMTKEMLAERPDLREQGLKAGDQFTVIAWLWARTVKCPNPACGAQMPLIRSFVVSKKGNKVTYISPIINRESLPPRVNFEVIIGNGQTHNEGTVKRTGAKCIACDTPVRLEYVRNEGKMKRIGIMPLAKVLKGNRQRIYVPSDDSLDISLESNFLEDTPMTNISGYLNPPIYGYDTVGSWFNLRQREAVRTFSQLVLEVKNKVYVDSHNQDYANFIALYLTLGVGRMANRLSSFAIWNNQGDKVEQTFSEQGVGMTWDYAEANPFSGSTGSWEGSLEWIPKCLEFLPQSAGNVEQRDAAKTFSEPTTALVSTDPPYYSSITYADFADYFYAIFRNSLRNEFPELFPTLTTPKADEAVAAWHRFGGKEKATVHFQNKLLSSLQNINLHTSHLYPTTVYYAFKQIEFEDNEGLFTAWESILNVLINSGLRIENTWPLRTERITGRKADKNSLSTSIVLVCRPRDINITIISRKDFIQLLKKEFVISVRKLQKSSIAPIDLAQASIGPGMAVFSRYSTVLEADGKAMSVRTALALINQALDEYLAEQEGEYDGDTRWALAWFEQFGHNEAPFGVAETLSKAKNTSVSGLQEAGILEARGGKVRLYRRDELDADWDPTKDKRATSWEAVQHLIHDLDTSGEQSAAELLVRLGSVAETARDLAYRLYTVCERKGWAQDALGYNMLVVAWPRLLELARRTDSQEALPLL